MFPSLQLQFISSEVKQYENKVIKKALAPPHHQTDKQGTSYRTTKDIVLAKEGCLLTREIDRAIP